MGLRKGIKRLLLWLQEFTTKPIVRVVMITLLAWVMSHTIIYDITSASIFTPIEKSNDFEMSDIYNVVADARPVRKLDTSIVIVGIDQCSREDVGTLVKRVNAVKPRVMGLDVIFGFPMSQDSVIIDIFNSSENLVLAADAIGQIGTVFADELTSVHWGAVNFFTKKKAGIVRQFKPSFDSGINAFSVEIARLADMDAYKKLESRGREYETICYPSQEYMVMDGVDILYGEYVDSTLLSDMLRGKVVLMGDIHNPMDRHLTPTDADMPGIVINAHVLSTILQGSFIDSPSKNVDWMLATFVSLLFSSIIIGCQRNIRIKPYSTFILRTSQIGLMTLFIYVGCFVFARWHFYCNFAPALMMIGLGILASALEPVVGTIIRKTLKYLSKLNVVCELLKRSFRRYRIKLKQIKLVR